MKPALQNHPTPQQQTDAQIRTAIMLTPSPKAFEAWNKTAFAVRARVVSNIVAGIWTLTQVIDYLNKGDPYHDDPDT